MDDAFSLFLGLALFAVVTVGACSVAGPSDESASSALSSAGYTQVEITDSSLLTFRCSESDFKVFDFNATNPAGDPTSGFVCCGVFKGCTVRH